MPLQPPVMAPYARIYGLGVLIVTDLYVPHPRPETASGHLWWQKLLTLLRDFGWLGVEVRQLDLFEGRNLLATNAGNPIWPSTIGTVVAEFPFPWPGTMPKGDEWKFRDVGSSLLRQWLAAKMMVLGCWHETNDVKAVAP